jgi:hypothetical protein
MYQEQARRHGQDISTTTDDATFAGGLRHITSVLPSLMNDIIQHAPDSQKVILKTLKKGTLGRNTSHQNNLCYCIHFYLFLVPPFSFRGRQKLNV